MSHGCARWRGDLGAYVIGALDREERAAMRRHLAACPACRADYEDLLPVRDWLASTKRHLATCRTCRADYENLLHLRLAH
jgi:predicted anti-sigma-YlaC factor YlaD